MNEPTKTKTDLDAMDKAALLSLASSLGIDTKWMREARLREVILAAGGTPKTEPSSVVKPSSSTPSSSVDGLDGLDKAALLKIASSLGLETKYVREPKLRSMIQDARLSGVGNQRFIAHEGSVVPEAPEVLEGLVTETRNTEVRKPETQSYSLSVIPRRVHGLALKVEKTSAVEGKICPLCHGQGSIELERTHMGIPIMEPCKCTRVKDIYRNLERGWKGVTASPRIKESPLLDLVRQDVYLTANDSTLRSHLKFIGIRMGGNWAFQVISDAELMTAWLANVALSGKEIYDFDVSEAAGRSLEKLTLLDLVEPPGLLIIRLGVKIARNSAMSEVFQEALTLRDHANKPTWVVDQPGNRLNQISDIPHRCYSPEAVNYLQEWRYLVLDEVPDKIGLNLDMLGSPNHPNPTTQVTFSGVQGIQTSSARQTDLPSSDDSRRGKKKTYTRGGT